MGRAAPKVWLPWTFRQVLAFPRSPWWLAGAVGAGFLLLPIPYHNATGRFDGVMIEGSPFWLHSFAVNEFAYAAALAYTIVIVVYLVRGTRRDLSQLGAVLGLDAAGLETLSQEVLSFTPRFFRIAGAASIALGLVIVWITWEGTLGSSGLEPRGPTFAWILAREVFVDFHLGRALVLAIAVALRLSRLGRERARVRLLDLRPLAPFSQHGVRLALFWLVIWAINIPFLLATPLSDAMFLTAAVMTGVALALSAVGLLLPTLGVHRRIQEAKAAELEVVWRQVEEARGLGENGQLPGLLAYESRIEATREWPFDAAALRRVGLYLLIPVASWVGGALIERLVDAALR